MLQLIYASRPFGFDAATLSAILAHARQYNAQNDITGALICRNDLYLQMLEGPSDEIEKLYKKICADDRHGEVTTLVRRPIRLRLFPDWAMRDDPVQSWMWSREDVLAGVPAKASEAEVIAIFIRLANKKPEVVRQTVPE